MKIGSIVITLSDGEIQMAALEGSMRTINGRRFGSSVVHGQTPERRDANNHDELGARGELAVARYLNRFPTGYGFPKAPDVGGYIEVRTVPDTTRRLIVHKEDRDEAPFVLVTRAGPLRLELVGWIIAKDAKRPEWWSDPQRSNRPAYFVPQSELLPMESLLEFDRSRS